MELRKESSGTRNRLQLSHFSFFSLSLSLTHISFISLSLTLTFTETLGIEKHRQVAIEHPITIYTKYIDIDVEYL